MVYVLKGATIEQLQGEEIAYRAAKYRRVYDLKHSEIEQ